VTNRGEIIKFIAIVIAMSLDRRENLIDYRSNDPVTQTPISPQNMARDRFLILLSFLLLNDNTKHTPRGAEGHDPLFKLGKPYTNILFRFSTTYTPITTFCDFNTLIILHNDKIKLPNWTVAEK